VLHANRDRVTPRWDHVERRWNGLGWQAQRTLHRVRLSLEVRQGITDLRHKPYYNLVGPVGFEPTTT